MKLNKKGIAITVILYAMVILVIAIFTLLLTTIKVRYKTENNLKQDVNASINNPKGILDYLNNTKCIDGLLYNGEQQDLIVKNNKVKYNISVGKNVGTYKIEGIAEDYYLFKNKEKKEILTCSIAKGTPIITVIENDKNIENGVATSFKYSANAEGTFEIKSGNDKIAKVKVNKDNCLVTGINETLSEKISTNIIIHFIPNDKNNYNEAEFEYQINIYNKCIDGIVCKEELQENDNIEN